MKLTIKELKSQIKNEDIKNLYLFFGEENYLAKIYADRILALIPDDGLGDFNRLIIEDAKTPLGEVSDYIETYPMMSDKKVLIVKDTGIFKSANEDIKSFWTERLSNLPEYITVIFIESEVDKRGVLYKAVEKAGYAVEFALLSETDTVTWVEREVLSANKKIKKENAQFLVEISGEGLGNLKNELDKLINYSEEEITRTDIEKVVSKSLNVRVFEMTDAIMEKNADKALSILYDMKAVKESAFKILYILFSTFDKMLLARLLQDEGEARDIIAKRLKVPPFVASKYMKKTFSIEFLEDAVIKIADADLAIKEGREDEWSVLEKFVADLFVK